MLAAVHELFENQRWNPETRTYGSEFLDPEEDPAPFSNRAHTEHAAYESLDDYPVPAGWEWADDQWTVDPYHNYACTTPDGWLYGATWSALKRNLIEGNTIGEERFKKLTGVVLAEYPVPVRWRRWVRRRERFDGVDEDKEKKKKEESAAGAIAGALQAPTGGAAAKVVPKRQFRGIKPTGRVDAEGKRDCLPGGLAQEVEESLIVCEGWLRLRKGGGFGRKATWKQVWAILIRDVDFGVGTLVFVDAFEAVPYKVQTHIEGGQKEANQGVDGLHVNVKPNIPDSVYKAMNEIQKKCCFGLGSKRPGKEHSMLRALSPGDAKRWIAAIESLESEESRPGNLVVEVRGARGLPHRDGNPNTYVTLRLDVGDRVEVVRTRACTKCERSAALDEEETAEQLGGLTEWLWQDKATHKQPKAQNKKFIFKGVFDDRATLTAIVAHAGSIVPVLDIDTGLGDHALGQTDFSLRDLDGMWRPDPPPPFGPRKAYPPGVLTFPKASTLPVTLVSNDDPATGQLALEVTWVPERGEIEDDKTDKELRKYLAYAEKYKDRDKDLKDDDGLRAYVDPKLAPKPSDGKRRFMASKLKEAAADAKVDEAKAEKAGGKKGAKMGALVSAASASKNAMRKSTAFPEKQEKAQEKPALRKEDTEELEARLVWDEELGDYRVAAEPEAKPGESLGPAGTNAAVPAFFKDAPTGEYQLRVHVIEARGLVGRDLNGMCDPFVEVKCFGQVRRSQVKDKETSPVWDENLFIIQKDVDMEQLDRAQIEVSVFDKDLIGADLIGSYFLDASYLYYQASNPDKPHTLYREWLVLTAPHEARAGGIFMDDSKEGAQGYLKCTISLVGPGDDARPGETPEDEKIAMAKEAQEAVAAEEARRKAKAKFAEKRVKKVGKGKKGKKEAEEEEEELLGAPPLGGAVVRAPFAQTQRTMVFLRISVHRASGLPDTDNPIFGGGAVTGGKLDAYCRVDFAGNPAQTHAVSSNQPSWDLEFWMPVLVPCSGQQVRVTVLDDDVLHDEEIGHVILDFDDILSGKIAPLAWYHLYGLGPAAFKQLDTVNPMNLLSLKEYNPIAALRDGKQRRELRRYPREYASEWNGKLLLEVHVLDPNLTPLGGGKSRGGIGSLLSSGPKKAPTLPEKVLQRATLLSDEQEKTLKERKYELRAIVLEGCNLGPSPQDIMVEVAIEDHQFQSAAPVVREGIATWLLDEAEQAVDPFAIADDHFNDLDADVRLPPGTLVKVNPMRYLVLPVASRKVPLPLAFLYILDKRTGERTHFISFKCEDLIAHGLSFSPTWHQLMPTRPVPIKPGVPPPAVLISIGLGCEPMSTNKTVFPWPPMPMPMRTSLAAYELRAHLYQARDLPARTDDGLLDPYVIISLAGQRATNARGKLSSETARETRDPLWYETLTMQMWLPPLELAPQLVLEVWDQQNISTSEVQVDKKRPSSFVGCRILSLRGLKTTIRKPGEKEVPPPEPRWLPLLESGTHTSGGDVLISFELLPLDPTLAQEPPPLTASLVGAVGSALAAPGKGIASILGLSEQEVSAKAAKAAVTDAAAAESDLPPVPRFVLAEPPVQLPFMITDKGDAPLRGAPALPPSREPLPLDISENGIQPPGTNARLHVVVLGLRGLERPAGLANSVTPRSANPFIEVDVSAFQRKVADEVVRTNPSNLPSAMNPTYLERLNIGLALADDPVFTPNVNIKVYDKMFGGLARPLLGSCSTSLDGRLNAQPPKEAGTTMELGTELSPAPVRASPTLIEDIELTDAPKKAVSFTTAATTAGAAVTGAAAATTNAAIKEAATTTNAAVKGAATTLATVPENVTSAVATSAATIEKLPESVAKSVTALTAAPQTPMATDPPLAATTTASAAASPSPPILKRPLKVETVEVWENERKTPGAGWSGNNLLPCDPPKWSEVDASLPHPERPQGVPPPQWRPLPKKLLEAQKGWEWVDAHWYKDDWGYAVTFEAGGKFELFDQGTFDVVRRRRWYRTRKEKLEPEAPKPSMPSPAVAGAGAAAGAGNGTAAVEVPAKGAKTLTQADGQTMTLKVADSASKNGATPVMTTSTAAPAPAAAATRTAPATAAAPAAAPPLLTDASAASTDSRGRALSGGSDDLKRTSSVKSRTSTWRASTRLGDPLKADDDDDDDDDEPFAVKKPTNPAEVLAAMVQARNDKEETVQTGIEECEARGRALLQSKAALLREKRQLETESKWKKETQRLKLANKVNLAHVAKEMLALERRLAQFENALDSDYLSTPIYMLNRKRVYHEAERNMRLSELPYEKFQVATGQGANEREIATLKAMVVLLPEVPEEGMTGALTDAHEKIISSITTTNRWVVRVYILRALNMLGTDADGDVDAYLIVKHGERVVLNTRHKYIKDCFNTASFFEVVEMSDVELPGDALITVEVWDRDLLPINDDMVGATVIDLEDRVYSPLFNDPLVGSGGPRPPLEWRSLYKPEFRTPTGNVEMWCEVLRPATIDEYPVLDILPPAPQDWELRVVVWKLEGVGDGLKGMDMGGMGDFQIKTRFGPQRMETDTHWRAKDGKASWNWRLKFPCTLTDSMKYQRLTLQLWDKDILTSDYMIGDATLNLDSWFRRSFKKRMKEANYWDGDHELTHFDAEKQSLSSMLSELASSIVSKSNDGGALNVDPVVEHSKLWLPLETPEGKGAGRLLVSCQLVPAKLVEKLEAGEGRSDPNQNPALPPPVGRLFFTLNPFSLLYQFLGPKNCRTLQICCCQIICCVLCIAVSYFFIPGAIANVVTAPITG